MTKHDKQKTKRFPHRLNATEGGYDSICLACAKTIVTGVRTEAELAEYERKHKCSVALSKLRRFLHTL